MRGLCFSRDGPGLQKLDLTDREQVAAVFADFNPMAVVHCAAERRPDVCEKDAEHTNSINNPARRAIGASRRPFCSFQHTEATHSSRLLAQHSALTTAFAVWQVREIGRDMHILFVKVRFPSRNKLCSLLCGSLTPNRPPSAALAGGHGRKDAGRHGQASRNFDPEPLCRALRHCDRWCPCPEGSPDGSRARCRNPEASQRLG